LEAVVPSGFTFDAGFLTGVAFAGLGFTGVALVVVEEAALVAFFKGVDPAVFVALLTGLESELLATGFFRTGSGFVVPRGVRVRAGFEASLTAVLPAATGVFAGVVVAAGLLAEAVVTGFFAGVELAAGVALVAVEIVVAGFGADAPAELSFLGTLFTGVAAELAVLVAVAGFLAGVALVAVVAGFFAVDSATLEMFPTLAERGNVSTCPLCSIYYLTLKCSVLLLKLVHG
jgi:hypothetical protein